MLQCLILFQTKKFQNRKLIVPFVDDYIEYTQDAESPTSYFTWCGYTAIAAVLRDNVWLQTNYARIYPNLYTIIVSGKSSATRKSIPMRTVLELVRHVENTKIIQGYASIAGIFDVLQSQQTNQWKATVTGGSALLYSEELTAFLYTDSATIDTLTDWYDYHPKYASALRGVGFKEIEKVCITLLATTNDENIQKIYGTNQAQKGGLLARTLLIREESRRHIKGPFRPRSSIGTKDNLKKQLLAISRLRGEFTLEQDAKDEINSWAEAITDEKISSSGIEARLATHVMKLCMILSAGERMDRVIVRDHVLRGIDECSLILKNYKMILLGKGKSKIAEHQHIVLAELYSHKSHKMTRRQLLQRLLHDIDLVTLNEVIETAVEAGYMEIENKNNIILVKLTDTALKMIEDSVIQGKANV